MADAAVLARPGDPPISVSGSTFSVHEWQGSGPARLHVQRADDEAWHVLDGTLDFRYADGATARASAGTTVFVPAGVAHTYVASEDARYLIMLTPRLESMVAELHGTDPAEHAAIYSRHESELLE